MTKAYLSSYNAWQTKLAEGRKHYLKLAGLFKLKPPVTAFGSAIGNDYRVRAKGAPARIGTYAQYPEGIEFRAAEGANVVDEDGNAVEILAVALDENGNSGMLYSGNLSWLIITRGGAPYIRVLRC